MSDSTWREVPDRYKHLLDREMVTIGHLPVRHAHRAAWRSLPTFRHATEAFERALELLGERAFVDPEGGDVRKQVYLRDSDDAGWVFGEPTLEWFSSKGNRTSKGPMMRMGGKMDLVPADAPAGWTWDDPFFDPEDPRPDILPADKWRRGGGLHMREGLSTFRMVWGGDGLKLESVISQRDWFSDLYWGGIKAFQHDPSARPPLPEPPSLLCSDLLRVEGVDVGTIAQILASLQPRGVGVRAWMPAPLPGGLAQLRIHPIRAMRKALWSKDVPNEARWLVCDGFEYNRIAWGATRQEAVQRWQDVIAERPPVPPPMQLALRRKQKEAAKKQLEPGPETPPPGPIKDKDGQTIGVSTAVIELRMEGSGAQLDWPDPVPENIPAALIELPPPLPDGEHMQRFVDAGFDRPVRVLDSMGNGYWVLVKERDDGACTVVGQHMLDVLNPHLVGPMVDAVLAEHDELTADLPTMFSEPNRQELTTFVGWDGGRQMPAPLRFDGSNTSASIDAGAIDGRKAAFGVVHLRQL